MSLARTHSIALVGVEGHPVEIEADIENGLVGLLLVGLPDTALREARDRIRSAIVFPVKSACRTGAVSSAAALTLCYRLSVSHRLLNVHRCRTRLNLVVMRSR